MQPPAAKETNVLERREQSRYDASFPKKKKERYKMTVKLMIVRLLIIIRLDFHECSRNRCFSEVVTIGANTATETV